MQVEARHQELFTHSNENVANLKRTVSRVAETKVHCLVSKTYLVAVEWSCRTLYTELRVFGKHLPRPRLPRHPAEPSLDKRRKEKKMLASKHRHVCKHTHSRAAKGVFVVVAKVAACQRQTVQLHPGQAPKANVSTRNEIRCLAMAAISAS